MPGDDRRMDNPPSILLETRSQAEATSKEAIISTALVVFCTVASAARPDVCNSANRFDLVSTRVGKGATLVYFSY